MAEVKKKVKLFTKAGETKGHEASSVKKIVWKNFNIYKKDKDGWPHLLRVEHRKVQIPRPI